MSTGQPHAKAESSILRSFRRSDLGTSDAESWFSVRIQVAGDFVALLVKESVDTVGGALEVWNYTRRPELSVSIILPDRHTISHNDPFLSLPVYHHP
jgi:hypothetical protein